MKLLFSALALAIAVPAAAQTGAGTDAHVGHAAPAQQSTPLGHDGHGDQMMHGQAGHDTHGKDHVDHARSGHDGCCQADGQKMPCCKKMAADKNKKADCCAKPTDGSAADGHAGH